MQAEKGRQEYTQRTGGAHTKDDVAVVQHASKHRGDGANMQQGLAAALHLVEHTNPLEQRADGEEPALNTVSSNGGSVTTMSVAAMAVPADRAAGLLRLLPSQQHPLVRVKEAAASKSLIIV